MIFDRLINAAEKGFSALLPLLRAARIFELPKRPQDFLPKGSILEEERQLIEETFFLPFRTIAVEDPASCIILQDREKDVRGSKRERIWIEIMPQGGADPNAYTEDPEIIRERNAQLKADGLDKELVIVFGEIHEFRFVGNGGEMFLDAHVGQTLTLDERTGRLSNWTEAAREAGDLDRIARASGENVLSALQEVMWINDPDHFVLEEIPEEAIKKRERSGSKKRRDRVPRTYERPRYTIMRPHNIRKRMGLPEPEACGTKRRPHERRAHLRTLRSSKFVNKKGQRITVKATWVGPKENTVGGKRYRVIVDL